MTQTHLVTTKAVQHHYGVSNRTARRMIRRARVLKGKPTGGKHHAHEAGLLTWREFTEAHRLPEIV